MLQSIGIAAVLMLALLAALPAIAQTGPAHVIEARQRRSRLCRLPQARQPDLVTFVKGGEKR